MELGASPEALDPHVRRIIEQARRADEIRAKYRIDLKMTFFSPDARPDDLGNVCPICRARTPTSARYADYVCDPCTLRAVDEHGQPIAFGNAGLDGGVVARVNGEKRDVTTCFIDGRACVVGEARFGGVVHSLAGVRAASEDPSRRGNRLAERVAGAVLGAAIGDAMGHPTEFVQSFGELRERFGPNGVEGFVSYRDEGGRRFAPYTDDTQLAELVLVSLLDARRAREDLDRAMTRLATAIVKWSDAPQGGHRAPGRACLAGAARLAGGAHWSRAGADDAGGSGSVMRAYPVGLVFHADVGVREAWAVAQSALTHRAP
ncbi:MAG TPA: ADP-ribosylglycohydrolase family protein, partial [Polyangiaceae bacterium]|nr:ADP-ribosylglycohydrolase family protein [Polyangiaceae bacterium]